MDVQIVVFPETNVAAIEHFGSTDLEHDTVGKLIAWKLEQGGELLGNFPIFFHYVNVGPNVREEEMITDVYLPLRQSSW
jgi:AraC family transcriptional regulator